MKKRLTRLDADLVPHLDELLDPAVDEDVEHDHDDVGEHLDEEELGPEDVEERVLLVAPEVRGHDGVVAGLGLEEVELEELGDVVDDGEGEREGEEVALDVELGERVADRVVALDGHAEREQDRAHPGDVSEAVAGEKEGISTRCTL